MNLSTVITNLRNTIAGKELLLTAKKKKLVQRPVLSDDQWFATKATIEFLEVNIDELNRILDDLVECQVKGIEHSWRDNPDRMGGQFTQDEIDNASKW